jgi:putative endonuclease
MAGSNQRIGKWGEDIAAKYLEENGYRILQRNFRTHYGELDLIVEKLEVIHFVEVKTRTGLTYGLPEEAVTAAKRAHLLRAVQSYWLTSDQPEGDWQVDVIAVLGRPADKDIQIEHFENALH